MKADELAPTVKAVGESVAKSIFGVIPFAGAALDELIFDFRSRIIQNRINHFADELASYFKETKGGDIDYSHIKSEEFGDVFYLIVKNVMQTKSEAKIAIFKDIFVNQLKKENFTDFTASFLDTVLKLDEKEIEILKYYYELEKSGDKSEIYRIKTDRSLHEKFGIDGELYGAYKFDLDSKGLIRDALSGGATPVTQHALFVEISPLGNKFVEFIIMTIALAQHKTILAHAHKRKGFG